MDWKTFFSQIIDSLAWPAVTVFVVVLLRDKITDLLPRLKKFKHKETEIEFTEGVAELVQEREAQGIEGEELAQKNEYQNQFGFLSRLADISPRSAVLESFRIVESAAAKKAARLYPDLESRYARSPLHLQKMLKGEVLSRNEFYQLDQLRKLRNEAAHAEEFEVRGMPVEAYIDIALSLASRLEAENP
ncbi:hypothetical protein PRZ61_01990 [Halomonas pacifica]|uniref:hypothetical protein n=1 Tax=Bisbaumannia pacifica TaxID=77098 RepID=UPI002358B804|nr:hypothetical protein [Halomonas pacifica]MDC8802221.1 hypothetical protein [Halomonas pacifica]